MAMTRRVLVFNHFAAPRGAPGGTRHVELFSRLRGWEAKIIAANRNYLTRAKTDPDGIYSTVWSFPYGGNGLGRVFNWISYAATATVAGLRSPRPDLVYASSPHLLAALAGWLVARIRRARFILEVRDLWPQVLVEMDALSERSLLFRALNKLERFLYRKADAIVVLSRGVRQRLVTQNLSAERVHLVPNGADPQDFVPPASRAELRSCYELEGLVFAYTGAHGPANGLDLLLDAAAELREELPDVTFLLVGDGSVKLDLIRRVERERLSNVRFLPPISKQEIPALLGAVDVGVHVLADVPLFSYGVSPNKLFDYMAAGLPVITNTPGEVAALVDEAGAGLAVGSRELSPAVRKMVEAGVEQRLRWGEAGRRYMATKRSRTALAARLEAVLDHVVSQ